MPCPAVNSVVILHFAMAFYRFPPKALCASANIVFQTDFLSLARCVREIKNNPKQADQSNREDGERNTLKYKRRRR